MSLNGIRRLAMLAVSAVLLLSACAPEQGAPDTQPGGDALTWAAWSGYDDFLDLAAQTSWLTTPEGMSWERGFLDGRATAAGMWEGTMDYIQQYIDIGMFHTDPEDRHSASMIEDYLGGRKAILSAGVTGRLYQDRISIDVTNAIAPALDGEYAVLTMAGAGAP